MITQLDTENADLNLTSYVLALTHTPSTIANLNCQVMVNLGSGAKVLDGTGGVFKVKIMIGGSAESHELSFTVTAGDTQVVFWSPFFPVTTSTAVKVYLLSPNGADTDITVTARIFDIDPLAYTPAEMTTVAVTLRDMMNQLWRRFFKKATQTATELKTYKNDTFTVVTTQTLSDDDTTQNQGAAS